MASRRKIDGLVHGFGRAEWNEADFLTFAVSRRMMPVIMRQLHSNVVHRLDEAPSAKLEGDALMTNRSGLLLVIRTADCLPVLLIDAENRAVAAVHCGWRGTEKRILGEGRQGHGRSLRLETGRDAGRAGSLHRRGLLRGRARGRDGFLRAGFPPSVFTERGHVPKTRVPSREAREDLGKALLDLRLARRPVEGLKLRFAAGRVVDVAAVAGREAVEAEMREAGDAGRAFREFALGFNPLLAVPDVGPWVPYYGYGAGVVRLSLGDNTELGGTVGGGYVRWNFFTDTTVTVGPTVWVRDGKLVVR